METMKQLKLLTAERGRINAVPPFVFSLTHVFQMFRWVYFAALPVALHTYVRKFCKGHF